MSKKNNFNVPVNALTSSYRTKFDMSHQVKGSFNHGKLIPFDVIECLPGDTFKIDLASIIRMSTPISPVMDNIHMCVEAYYIPNRLVDENWEQLMGVNKTGAWLTDKGTYVTPVCDFDALGFGSVSAQKIGDYMGLPLTNSGAFVGKVNALPGRAYALIWNEYFRSPVVSAPLPINRASTDNVLVSSATVAGTTESVFLYDSDPLPLCKYADYFTKCLPQPIKHEPIPFIADNLAVGAINPATGYGDLGSFQVSLDGEDAGSFQSLYGDDGHHDSVSIISKTLGTTWNTIEALRTAFQLDKFYYKDSYARNYRDMLLAHFNVDNKDSVMQLPQLIGSLKWQINIDQVLSTAGYSASTSTTVGAPGANSVTTGKGSLTTFSCSEHGFIIIVGGTRHDHTYGQGYRPMWRRSDRLDYYDPVFARIGDQPVDLYTLYAFKQTNDPNPLTTVFGYQEAWAEYRFIPDRVCGILNPIAANSLDFWTLADKFDAAPQLNETFIYENRNSLSRALVTGVTGPDYIFDFYFKVTAVREMPLFSVPGLADHF